MSSNLKVNTILPSTGTNIGVGTAGGVTTVSGAASVDTNLTLGGDIIHSGDDTKIRFPSNDLITFETAGNERVRIDSNGKVGINSAIPTEALEVRGNVFVRGATSSDRPKIKFGFTNAVIRSGKTEGNVGIDLLSISGNDSRDDLVVSFDGKIGIGTTTLAKEVQIGSGSTTSQLQINGHGNGFDICSTSGDIAPHFQSKFILYNGQIGSGVERFRVSSAGYVTTPHNVMFAANGGQSDITNAVFVFSNVLFQRGGSNYNNSNGYFTAPVDGIYMFMCNPYRYTDSNDSQITFQKSTNGGSNWSNYHEVRAYTGYSGDSARGWMSLTMSTLIDLNKNDVVRIFASNRCHANSTVTVYSGMLVG